MTPDDVEALADTRYDTDVYDNTEQKLFALLVDVAWAYELHLRRNMPDPTEDPGGRPQSLAELANMTPRDMMLSGLVENLEMKEGDRT